MPVTIYDIAKKANVAPSTVSRALQDHPRIGAETKARIQNLARKMGYVPNVLAHNLRTHRTSTIGVVFTDAVIIVASPIGPVYGSPQNQYSIPIVLVEPQEHGDAHPSVSTDNKGGAILAVEHLIALGHRRSGYIGAIDRPVSNKERLLGYKTALAQSNLPISPELILLPDTTDDIERGRMGLIDMQAEAATAVFCYNDRTAFGLVKECERQKILDLREFRG